MLRFGLFKFAEAYAIAGALRAGGGLNLFEVELGANLGVLVVLRGAAHVTTALLQ